MTALGGSIFTYNVDNFDYCYREAIQSLIVLCDEVVVMDCGSTDGTLATLRQIAAHEPKVRLVEGALWDCAPKHHRLAVLANQAKSYLTTPWHFMLQADEVLHENSCQAVRNAIGSPNGFETFFCRRWNLFGDFDHYISLASNHKPCSDAVVRLGRTRVDAIGDAESLNQEKPTNKFLDAIDIFHYGLVRKSSALIEKSLDMQTWFHGGYEHADHRIKKMKAEGTFDPFALIARSELAQLQRPHPVYMKDWMAARADEKKAWMA